jgi:hypothetical protein
VVLHAIGENERPGALLCGIVPSGVDQVMLGGLAQAAR